MVSNCNDPLENRSIVFGVRVYCPFQARICLSPVHVLLDIHHLLENPVDVSFGKVDLVEMYVSFFDTKIDASLLFLACADSLWLFPAHNVGFLEIDINNRCKDFVHALFVGNLRVPFTPYK